MVSAIFFTLCNEAITEITQKVGPFCIFYFASGSIITGFIYNAYMSICIFWKMAG